MKFFRRPHVRSFESDVPPPPPGGDYLLAEVEGPDPPAYYGPPIDRAVARRLLHDLMTGLNSRTPEEVARDEDRQEELVAQVLAEVEKTPPSL